MKKILTFFALLCALAPVRAQYESFFGDSTWEYHIVYLTNPPEDYIDYPPENPNLINAYCRTYQFKYRKDYVSGVTHHFFPISWNVNSFPHWSDVYEKTDLGQLYVDPGFSASSTLVCDMSLEEGDTFNLKDPCIYYDTSSPGVSNDWIYDTIGDRLMIVDSVRYIAGRKTIFLSLIDHLEDYFFGTEYNTQLSDYNFSIRFIEGIGATYGLLPGCRTPNYASDLYPSLGLLLCMYKDGDLVYMADDNLGCDQTCVGVKKYPQIIMNLYPNPATQHVVLDMSTGEEMNGSVAITDMLGRVCHQQKADGTSVRISVSDLPTGMYVLSYTDGKNKVTRKFLKQ